MYMWYYLHKLLFIVTVSVIIIMLMSLIILSTSSIMFIMKNLACFFVLETGYDLVLLHVLVWLHGTCFVMIYILFNFVAIKVHIRTAGVVALLNWYTNSVTGLWLCITQVFYHWLKIISTLNCGYRLRYLVLAKF